MSVINTNSMSLNAQRNLSSSQGALSQSIQRLSSGLRVNSARDDAAGLAIASRMDSQVRGMNVAIRNANDGISMAQTAEGALGKVSDMLQRMRELAVQSANQTNNADDRGNLDEEFKQLSMEVQRTLDGTKFNGNVVFSTGDLDNTFQVGAGSSDTIAFSAGGVNLSTVASTTGESLGTTAASASAMIDELDDALQLVNEERATWGAMQNRFEAAISTLQVNSENTAAARSRIMDADFAKETAALTRAQILQQAGTAMLAQANSAPQGVLSLLRG
jgi:flagellin